MRPAGAEEALGTAATVVAVAASGAFVRGTAEGGSLVRAMAVPRERGREARKRDRDRERAGSWDRDRSRHRHRLRAPGSGTEQEPSGSVRIRR
ncbi:hypothetical protein GCM10010230_44060 [Streptomyces narbonensis]|nr:hypothetical protein GCM10010230_44060 [Streptomyces narbonensis]